ncbi:hypothetical protein [Kutzneria kofuensis]|uniref:Uncharacterized protein n=1 Tax=Kutzneria kofuensis TaxID=103725 RepID=A0A7W9NLS2_9PSEU|nr:hypothetical protein [Kutzneria kofuensis]MBB5896603.1 hypothetical protein [Kutzneria kofuensis]
MVISQLPSQRSPIPEPEVVGIDDLPVLFSYPPLHGWTLHSLLSPAAVRCATCDQSSLSVLVATHTASGEILCAACYGVSAVAAAAVQGGWGRPPGAVTVPQLGHGDDD